MGLLISISTLDGVQEKLYVLDFSPKRCIMWEEVVESGRTPVAPAFTC